MSNPTISSQAKALRKQGFGNAQIAAMLANGPQFAAPVAVTEAVAASAELPVVDLSAPTPTPEPAKPAKFDVKAFAQAQGLDTARGLVYLSEDAILAAARVAKSGEPVILDVDGSANKSHIALFLTDKGTVGVQNLYTPKQ